MQQKVEKYVEIFSTVMCTVRTTDVKWNFENMWGMYMDESPTVMCTVRTTEVKRNLENM